MSATVLSHAPQPRSQPGSDHARRAASDEPLSLNTVLGDLGAWLDETERHRKRVRGAPTVR